MWPVKNRSDADKQSREIKYNPRDPKYPSDAYHVFAENQDVDDHNKIMLERENCDFSNYREGQQ